RNAAGQWVGKGAEPKPGEAPPATGAPAAAAAAAPGAQPPAPEAGKSPFRYRAMGQTHALEGATVDAEGNITVPAAKTAELREAFNALHQRNASFVPSMQR